jgi:hypothetical protein
VEGKDIGDGAIERRRYARRRSQLDDPYGKPAHFEPVSALKVMMH